MHRAEALASMARFLPLVLPLFSLALACTSRLRLIETRETCSVLSLPSADTEAVANTGYFSWRGVKAFTAQGQ